MGQKESHVETHFVSAALLSYIFRRNRRLCPAIAAGDFHRSRSGQRVPSSRGSARRLEPWLEDQMQCSISPLAVGRILLFYWCRVFPATKKTWIWRTPFAARAGTL